jgi:ferredoxin
MFIDEARRTPGYSLFDWLHGYAYARWPYLYIGLGTREHPLSSVVVPLVLGMSRLFGRRNGSKRDGDSDGIAFAEGYHGKVVPLESAKQLVMIDEEIDLRNLEQVIPYSRARDIVMRNPDHLIALECPCRASRANPCLPLDVCLIVGEPFASFVAEHHPRRSRRITREEAVQILTDERDRGHVHHAFFKDAMLGRFYAICNCCACCCGAMQAWFSDTPMLASSGYVCRADVDQCVGCGKCAELCQFNALTVEDGRVAVDEARCMGCGVCVSQCARGALSLARDPGRGEPLEIQALIAAVA